MTSQNFSNLNDDLRRILNRKARGPTQRDVGKRFIPSVPPSAPGGDAYEAAVRARDPLGEMGLTEERGFAGIDALIEEMRTQQRTATTPTPTRIPPSDPPRGYRSRLISPQPRPITESDLPSFVRTIDGEPATTRPVLAPEPLMDTNRFSVLEVSEAQRELDRIPDIEKGVPFPMEDIGKREVALEKFYNVLDEVEGPREHIRDRISEAFFGTPEDPRLGDALLAIATQLGGALQTVSGPAAAMLLSRFMPGVKTRSAELREAGQSTFQAAVNAYNSQVGPITKLAAEAGFELTLPIIGLGGKVTAPIRILAGARGAPSAARATVLGERLNATGIVTRGPRARPGDQTYSIGPQPSLSTTDDVLVGLRPGDVMDIRVPGRPLPSRIIDVPRGASDDLGEARVTRGAGDISESSKRPSGAGNDRPFVRAGQDEPEDILRMAVESQAKGERLDEAILRHHQGMIDEGERLASDRVSIGNNLLRDRKIGKTVRGALVIKEEEIPLMDELYNALHNPSKVADGSVRVPAGLEDVYDNLRELTRLEETARLDFNPKMATIEDYFYRGWIPPEGFVEPGTSAIGGLGGKARFGIPRNDATYADMRALGFRPISWNPFEQWRISKLQGVRHRQQEELVRALRKSGDDLIRPHEGGTPPTGFRVPEVGPAFQGKSYVRLDAEGTPISGRSRQWIARNDVANSLEGMYGVAPDWGGTVKIMGRDVSIQKSSDWGTFVPKRGKLFASFFQQVDFINRAGNGAWENFVTALLYGKPYEAVKSLALYPPTVLRILAANALPSARANIRREFNSTEPLLKDRKISMRDVIRAGVSVRDEMILPKNLDDMARQVANEAGVLGKVKGLAKQINELESVMRRGLFNGVYPTAIITDIRNNMVPVFARLYPNLTDAQLAARVARAVNIKWSTIPGNQSVVQNRFIREALKRLMFSLNENEGLLRGALGAFKGPNKRYWQAHWLGVYLNVMATANVMHYAATREALPIGRWSPLDFDKTSLFGTLPFDYNTAFASPDIPVLGRSLIPLTLDLVGQMDTAFRVLNPISFIDSRTSVPVRAAINLFQGTEFTGQRTDTVGPLGVVSRVTQLARDLFEPIGPGPVIAEAIRHGVPGAKNLLTEGEVRLGITGQAIQGTGLNLRAASSAEIRDIATRAGNYFDQNGNRVLEFDELEPNQQADAMKQEPWATELKLRQKEGAARGWENAVRGEKLDKLKEQVFQDQMADDENYGPLGSSPEPAKWRDRLRQRQRFVDGQRTSLFADLDKKEPENARDRFFAQRDKLEAEHNGLMTDEAHDQLERWLVTQPIDDQEFVARNVGYGDYTPTVQLYYKDLKTIVDSGYFDVGEDFLDNKFVEDSFVTGKKRVTSFRETLSSEQSAIWNQWVRGGRQTRRSLEEGTGNKRWLPSVVQAYNEHTEDARLAIRKNYKKYPGIGEALLRQEWVTSPKTIEEILFAGKTDWIQLPVGITQENLLDFASILGKSGDVRSSVSK
jgi:hypothetical protein